MIVPFLPFFPFCLLSCFPSFLLPSFQFSLVTFFLPATFFAVVLLKFFFSAPPALGACLPAAWLFFLRMTRGSESACVPPRKAEISLYKVSNQTSHAKKKETFAWIMSTTPGSSSSALPPPRGSPPSPLRKAHKSTSSGMIPHQQQSVGHHSAGGERGSAARNLPSHAASSMSTTSSSSASSHQHPRTDTTGGGGGGGGEGAGKATGSLHHYTTTTTTTAAHHSTRHTSHSSVSSSNKTPSGGAASAAGTTTTRWSALSQTGSGHRRGETDDRNSGGDTTDWANYVELDSAAKRLVIMVGLACSVISVAGFMFVVRGISHLVFSVKKQMRREHRAGACIHTCVLLYLRCVRRVRH